MQLRALLLLLLPLTLPAAEWPQYRGMFGDGRTGEKIGKLWASAPPKQVWKTESEGGFASFAVGGGRAFTLALKEFEGAQQESIVALDAKTGKELWSAPLNFAKYDGGGDSGAAENKGGDGPRSTPSVYGNIVFAFSSQLCLRCFDAATGKIVWTRDLLKDHNGRNIQWQNAASPLLESGLLYVAGGGQGESILALNPKDGAVAWKAF